MAYDRSGGDPHLGADDSVPSTASIQLGGVFPRMRVSDLAKEVWDHQRGAAVYRSLLDRIVARSS